MRNIEWAFLFVMAGAGILLANLVGFQVGVVESLPGVLVLVGLSFLGMLCAKLIPLKLPIVAYVSVLGLAVAGPWCPVSGLVVGAVSQINLTAPLTLVGAFAGIGVSDQLGFFAKQGWKMVVVGLLFMTGSFVLTAVVAQLLLGATGVI